MKYLLLILVCSQIAHCVDIPLPSPQQLEYQDWEVGAMISFAMYTFAPNISISWIPSPDVYNPQNLSTDSWLLAASAFNAKYAVFTAKHDAGFCAWPTTYPGYNYSVKYTSWESGNGNVVASFIDSCNKYNIKPAIYYSVATNFYMQVTGGRTADPSKQQEYAEIVEWQLTELWSTYGDLAEIWFDGGLIPVSEGGPNVYPLIRKFQPNALIFNAAPGMENGVRWIGNENGIAPQPQWSSCSNDTCTDGTPGTWSGPDLVFMPAECDTPLRGYLGAHQWFWQSNGAPYVKPVDRLIFEYQESVGHNCNYMLNIAPNPEGTIDNIDMQRYLELGVVMQAFNPENAIASTSGNGTELTLELSVHEGVWIDRIMIQENQEQGIAVTAYAVSAQDTNGDWIEIVTNGTSIGHKKIDWCDSFLALAVRFQALGYIQTPSIRNFAVYFVGPN